MARGLIFITVVLTLTSSLGRADVVTEQRYLNIRQAILAQFKNTPQPSDKDNTAAVKQLDGLIGPAVGAIRIQGVKAKWKSNVRTFQRGPEYGRADGVEASSKNFSLFVSTPRLLAHFRSKTTFDITEFSKDEDFLAKALVSDSQLVPYFYIPMASLRGISAVRTFVGLQAKETGPFEPQTLVVMAHVGNQIILISENLKDVKMEIPACKSAWSKDEKDEAAAFKAFRECYQKNAESQSFFSEVLQHAASLVRRLARS